MVRREEVNVVKYYRLVDLKERYFVVTVLFSRQRDVQLMGAAFVGSSACPACAPLLLALPIPSGHMHRPTSWAFSPPCLAIVNQPLCIVALANSCHYRKIS